MPAKADDQSRQATMARNVVLLKNLDAEGKTLQSLTRLFENECSGRNFLVDLGQGPTHLFQGLSDPVFIFHQGKAQKTIALCTETGARGNRNVGAVHHLDCKPDGAHLLRQWTLRAMAAAARFCRLWIFILLDISLFNYKLPAAG